MGTDDHMGSFEQNAYSHLNFFMCKMGLTGYSGKFKNNKTYKKQSPNTYWIYELDYKLLGGLDLYPMIEPNNSCPF